MLRPRKAAEQRRQVRRQQEVRVRRAVRRSGLADRTPQGWDWESELRRQQGRRST